MICHGIPQALTSALWMFSLLYLATFCLFLEIINYDSGFPPNGAEQLVRILEISESLIYMDSVRTSETNSGWTFVETQDRHLDRSLMQWDYASVLEYRRLRFRRAQCRPVTEGPGENGSGVTLTAEEQSLADRLMPTESLNVIASEKIAMDRSLADTRHPQ